MARKADPGLQFYRMETNHYQSPELRLFLRDTKDAGYRVWHYIINEAYRLHGYYYATEYHGQDPKTDQLELLGDAMDKGLEEVLPIVQAAVRRGLFDREIFERTGVLTCFFMQDFYIRHATAERRKKGGRTTLDRALLVPETLEITMREAPHLELVHVINSGEDPGENTEEVGDILGNIPGASREESTQDPGIEEFLPGGMHQSKVKESKVNTESLNTVLTTGPLSTAEPRTGEEGEDKGEQPIEPPPGLPRRDKAGRFHSATNPRARKDPGSRAAPPRPHWQTAVDEWFNYHRLTGRAEPSFKDRDPKHFEKIYDELRRRAEKHAQEWTDKHVRTKFRQFFKAADLDPFLHANFLLKQLLEKFDKVISLAQGWQPEKAEEAPRELQTLYDAFLIGKLDKTLVKAEHFEEIKDAWPLQEKHQLEAARVRSQNLQGSNKREEVEILQEYLAGRFPLEDLDRRTRLATRLAVVDYFAYLQGLGTKKLPNQAAPVAAKALSNG